MKLKRIFADKQFYRTVFTLAIPLMTQQLITSSVNLVDNLMVGQLGDIALGAVASVNRYYMICNFGVMGVLTAVSIFIAQFYGAKNYTKMKESFRLGLILGISFCLVFMIAGLLFPSFIIGFFTSNQDIIYVGSKYLRIAVFTYIPFSISLTISLCLRAIGETKIPLVISSIAVFTNTFLNYCLIFGNFGFNRLGVVGAGYATVIARSLELIIYLIVLKRLDIPFKTHITKLFVISKTLINKIMIKAFPLCINELLWALGQATLFKFYATRGKEVLSGYAMASTIADIFFVLFAGMSIATTVLVSQQLGANELQKAKDNAYKMYSVSVLLSIVFGCLLYLASFFAPSFYQVSAEAKEVCQNVLQVMAVMFWVYMATAQSYFILRAGGDMNSALILDSLYMFLVNIPLVGIIAYFTNVDIITLYIISQSTDFIKLLLSFYLVRKEKWVVNLAHH